MSEHKATPDRVLARLAELKKLNPGDDVWRQEVRKLLSDLDHAAWSRGYDEARADWEGQF